MARTFEDIALDQGWNDSTQLDLLRQFIRNQQDEDALADYAADVAAAENEGF